MVTAEITRADRSLVATSSLGDVLLEITEKERLVAAPAVESRPEAVRKPIDVRVRGETVQFTYRDSGEPKPDWFIPILQGFASLYILAENWDGEGARRIDRSVINRALRVVEQLLPPKAPAPSVVPISNSGLQIEWHRNQKDLEIEFFPNGEVEFYYFDEATNEEQEGPVGPNFTALKEYLPRIW